ncbi:MAG TPA: protoheme IX farnesyltransferase [Actinobacteria bacterium]|nr:protoheme IX farnesyltransferase [Actinomycetota bacterium]
MAGADPAAPVQGRPAPARVRRVLSAYVRLTKPRIIELLLVTTVPAMVLADRGIPSLWLMLATLAGGTLAAGGANAINQYLDRDIDQIMSRTRGRPLPAHAIEPRRALAFGIALGLVSFGFLTLTVNLLSAVLSLAALAFYVFVYTMWLKRRSTQNIVIGGAAGAVPALVGWAAVTGRVGWPAVVLFAIVFVWTPPHFWALALRYQGDYAAAGIPMLPVVAGRETTVRQILWYSIALVATSLVLIPVGHVGWFYAVAAIGLGAEFVRRAVRLRSNATTALAMSLFGYSIVYLAALFLAVAVDTVVRRGV